LKNRKNQSRADTLRFFNFQFSIFNSQRPGAPLARFRDVLAVVALLLFAVQQPPRLEETIVVTAERLEQRLEESTAAVTVLRGEELQQLPATNLGEALALVPGLQLLAVNPGAPPMIASRGFFGAGEVEYLQLRIDGVPVGDAESGLADWRSVPLASIDRIEVLRGAGSSLFGDTALGGVVQVFRRGSSHASLSAGSFGLVRWDASYAGDGFAIGANVVRSDGFRIHSASEERFARSSFARGRISLTLDASQRERNDPGPLGEEALYAFDREKSHRARGALRYDDESLEALLHLQTRDSEQVRTLLFAPGFGDRALRELTSRGVGAALTKTVTLKTARIASGVDAEYETLDSAYLHDESHEELARGNGSRRRASAFASGEWRVTSKLRIATGARWDAIDDAFAASNAHDRAFSPRLGASLDLGVATAYLQLSQAFKAPTLDQRFDIRPLPQLGVRWPQPPLSYVQAPHEHTKAVAAATALQATISNPDLVSQRSKNIELGLRGGAWEVIGYDTSVDDEIDFDLNTFRYANIGRSRHVGVETRFVAHPASALSARLTYAWTRVRPLDGANRGKQLKNIAEHVARLGVDLRSTLDVHVEVAHSASRWLDDAHRFPLDDATVVDVRVARALGALTAALDARNLFDRRYAPLGFALGDVAFEYPAEGRSVAFTLSWQPLKGTSP
jgi:outer membrane receptor protein involved in Fe transport